jgi:hypothetical protein
MKKKRNKMTLTLEFNAGDETFSKFCKALIDGGFDYLVRSMAQELLAEAKRRKLPIAAEIEARNV